jgi:hypothetical protein
MHGISRQSHLLRSDRGQLVCTSYMQADTLQLDCVASTGSGETVYKAGRES